MSQFQTESSGLKESLSTIIATASGASDIETWRIQDFLINRLQIVPDTTNNTKELETSQITLYLFWVASIVWLVAQTQTRKHFDAPPHNTSELSPASLSKIELSLNIYNQVTKSNLTIDQLNPAQKNNLDTILSHLHFQLFWNDDVYQEVMTTLESLNVYISTLATQIPWALLIKQPQNDEVPKEMLLLEQEAKDFSQTIIDAAKDVGFHEEAAMCETIFLQELAVASTSVDGLHRWMVLHTAFYEHLSKDYAKTEPFRWDAHLGNHRNIIIALRDWKLQIPIHSTH